MSSTYTGPIHKGEILVVEDNESDLKLLSRILGNEGYRVRPTGDGELALRSVHAKTPELIILDINLPGRNGVSICRELKSNPQTESIPVIFISAIGHTELKVKSLQAGAVDYITKPFEAAEVIARVVIHMNMHRLQERLRSQTEKLEIEIAERRLAEDALQRSNQELEMRVKQRTSELSKVNRELKDSEEKFRQLIENINEVFWIKDARTNQLLYISPNFEKIWGLSIESITEDPQLFLDSIIPGDRDKVCSFFSRQKDDEAFELKYRIIRPDGIVRWIHGKNFPVFDEHGNVYRRAGINEDITEIKEIEDRLFQSQKMESIGTLAGGVAHEINNPINGIMNYAQLIKDSVDKDNPLTEYTTEIIVETKRVAAIVRNLLTFARQVENNHSLARISDIAETTLSLIRTVIRHDQIILNIDIPDDLPEIRCRSQQIRQVLMNLMTNARDALNERYPGFHENKKMIISSKEIKKQGKRWIRTTVEDHGPGIPLAIRERIFDPFFTTKPRKIGTGLGLSISYGIVRTHHGQLHIESLPGSFTRFHLDLLVEK